MPKTREVKLKDYKLKLVVVLSLPKETLLPHKELIKARVNEMLGNMEHIDEAKHIFMHKCEVEEYK